MALKIDLHLHTHYSKDSWLTLESLIKEVKKSGLDGVAVTDHDTIKGALKLKAMDPPFKVIVAEEIFSQAGDIIGYFLKQEIPHRLSAEETIKRIKAQGGLVSIPHPFDRIRRCRLRKNTLEKFIDQIDLIEVFNGRTLWPQAAAQAKQFAQRYQLPQVAGSDAHSSFELGRSYTEIEDFEGPIDFMAKVKTAKVVDGHNPFWFYPLSGLAKAYHYVGSL